MRIKSDNINEVFSAMPGRQNIINKWWTLKIIIFIVLIGEGNLQKVAF